VYGAQDLDARESAILDFADGRTAELAAKPVMLGSGCNLQRHCAWAIFLGIGFKFSDFIQAVHRLQRFLQTRPVRIDLIYTEAERTVRQTLERKWAQHEALVATMAGIIQEYGLAHTEIAAAMRRSIGVARQEASGEGWRCVNADAVEETRALPADSAHLIVTSIPFATQYEYTPSYNDFGHNDDTDAFWRQMDYLTPELVRVLQPGRVAVIHVKDRIAPGGLTGLGFQTLQPFHAEAIFHYRRHGLAFLGMKTVVTDVVRENNQTYRLGWTEQCKDGSRMGCGVPEYLLLFRKPPTDRSNGYADVPVAKTKRWYEDETGWAPAEGYSLARWQVDANAFQRSNGDRPLLPDELRSLPHATLYQRFRDFYSAHVYDYAAHVAAGETLIEAGRLPVTFNLLPPPSWHLDVWTDVARMRTLNMMQERKGQQMHLCPLQFDIVDRLIVQLSQPGELVFDPFAGLMTVVYCAIKLRRHGLGIELNADYWRDGVAYCAAAAAERDTPTLFDLDGRAAEASA
jgi:SAM-dependent methyltransferase